MDRNQNGRNRNLASPVPGCLGRMVNLFDFNTSLGANRLLTDKPHYEGSPVSRCQSDLSRTRIVEDRMNDKMVLSELAKSPSNRKSNGTPIKMLIAQEMSKEEGPKQSPPNLVAKLMGLDTLPERHQLGSASSRSNPRRTRSHSGSLDSMQKEHGFLETKEYDEMNQSCKDVFEIWQQSPQKGRCKESKNEKNMALIREKFMEAKRLSTDEKLRQSKQFQDALEVLSSNKDLLLKFFQEPNSLFSQHLNLQSLPPPPDSRRITVLRPSKLVDGHKFNKNGKQINEALQMGHCNSFDKSYKLNDNPKPTQPTRIVVLKPSSVKPHEMEIAPSPPSTSNDDGFYGDLEDTKESTHGISSGHRRDETLLSSVFSNGYIGDESSFSKSEVYYAAGNLSDSEVMSPISRHSWDYVNHFGSPYSSSSFSRASCSPESSVCREAKKRLSERWAMMSLNGGVQEQRHIRRSSSTLGEMLALSDLKKEEHCENREGFSSSNKVQDDADSSPKTLVRSKSVPVSSASILGEVSESLKVKKGDTKDLTKEKSVKSSLFKGLFFSKSRKSSKKSQKDDEHQSSRNIGDDGSECINNIDGSLRKESCHPADDIPEPETFGNPNENQDQPSPNSVLDLQIEDDDHTASCSYTAKLKEHGVDPMKFNLIDKSPPIGSISRTLSWDESSVGPGTPVPVKTLSPEEEEQEYFVYVQTLLSVTGINGSSPENPLDPSLRDTYMSLTGTDVMVHRSKQRHQRSTQRLVFDCVNEALSGAHVDQVWDRMKEWISGKERCVWEGDDEDGSSIVVERVVRREVVGRVWVEDLRLEIDEIKKEIEEKLVEELVEELTGSVILGYTL